MISAFGVDHGPLSKADRRFKAGVNTASPLYLPKHTPQMAKLRALKPATPPAAAAIRDTLRLTRIAKKQWPYSPGQQRDVAGKQARPVPAGGFFEALRSRDPADYKAARRTAPPPKHLPGGKNPWHPRESSKQRDIYAAAGASDEHHAALLGRGRAALPLRGYLRKFPK